MRHFYQIPAAFLLLSNLAPADLPPQPDVTLTRGVLNTWDLAFDSVRGRSYFLQASGDLANWRYVPAIDSGDGLMLHWGFECSDTKQFVRLIYTDEPTTDPDLDDFDGDGVSNIGELRVLATDPFAANPWVDADHDGIHDALELYWFGNLTGTSGAGADADANGIPDVFELQAGDDPNTDQTGDPSQRSNYQYDSMGRLIVADDETFGFDVESNLETATISTP